MLIEYLNFSSYVNKSSILENHKYLNHSFNFILLFLIVLFQKLADLSLRIQQIETTLNILDAKVCISE